MAAIQCFKVKSKVQRKQWDKYEVETVSKIHSCNYTEKIVPYYGRHLAQLNSIMVYSSVAVAFHKYT